MPAAESRILHVGIKHHVVAIESSSGRELWRRELEPRHGAGLFTTLAAGGGLVLAGNGGEAFCLDPQDGALRWQAPLPRLGQGLVCFAFDPEGGPRAPVFAGIKHHVVALDRASGNELWRQPLKPRSSSTATTTVMLDGGRVLAAHGGEVFALDPRTGASSWRCELPKLGTGLVAFAGQGAAGAMACIAAAQAAQAAAAAAMIATSG